MRQVAQKSCNILFDEDMQAQQNIMLALNQIHSHRSGERLEDKYAVILGNIVMKLVDIATPPTHEEEIHDRDGYAILYETMIALDRIEHG